MRILLLVHLYPPQHHAGTENLTHGLAKALLQAGHEVLVLAGAIEAEEGGTDTHDGVTVHRLPSPAVVHSNPAGEQAVADTIGSFRPDVLHVMHLQRHGVGIIAVAARYNLPCVFTATDFWIRCPMSQLTLPDGRACTGIDPVAGNCLQHIASVRSGASRHLARLPAPLWQVGGWLAGTKLLSYTRAGSKISSLARRNQIISAALGQIAACIAPSEPIAEALLAMGVPAKRIHRLPYGLPDLGPAPQVERGKRGPLRFGCMATLSAHKGLHIAAQALANIPRTLDCTLDIWGAETSDVAYVSRLRRLAASDQRIRIHPAFSPELLGLHLSHIDMLLVPSLWIENAPLVAASAMTVGCPVLGSDVAGIAVVVEAGRSAKLIPPGDVAAWTASMTDYARNPNLVHVMSQSTRPTLPTMPNYTKQVCAIYDLVTKGAA